MAGDHDTSPTERFVERSRIDQSGMGRPLTERAVQRERTVEGYLKGQVLPRFISRARDIERAIAEHEKRLAEARAELRETCPPEEFPRRWRDIVASWDLREVNLLIRQHNEWYPVERDLPMDPRTGEWVLAGGFDFRKRELDAAWILSRYPAA